MINKILNKYFIKIASQYPYPGYTPMVYPIESLMPDMEQEFSDHRESYPVHGTLRVETHPVTFETGNSKSGQTFETHFIFSSKPFASVTWTAYSNSSPVHATWTPKNTREHETEHGSLEDLFEAEKVRILNNYNF